MIAYPDLTFKDVELNAVYAGVSTTVHIHMIFHHIDNMIRQINIPCMPLHGSSLYAV